MGTYFKTIIVLSLFLFMLMNVDVPEYIKNLYNVVPVTIYLSLFLILCVGVVTILSFRGLKNSGKLVFRFTLLIYVILILCSTVFCRKPSDYQAINYFPFWSYKAIFEGKEHMIVDNILNVVVFVPLGLLIGLGFRNIKWNNAFSIGFGMSVSIEVSVRTLDQFEFV